MKLIYLLLLFMMISCVRKAEKQEIKTDIATESNSITLSDVALNDSIILNGSLTLDDIENLHVSISNNSGRNILVKDRYEIMVLNGQQWDLLFDEPITSILINQGEDKEIKINLRLEKFKYSKKSQYQFRVHFQTEKDESLQYELSCPFKTADMWKNGKSLVIVPDTIINH